MIRRRELRAAFAAAMLLVSRVQNATPGREPRSAAERRDQGSGDGSCQSGPAAVQRRGRAHRSAEQERGLMFRTNLPADGGMLFAPYPAAGGGPREASFWMKNTPSALDIIFIRPNGTIAAIAVECRSLFGAIDEIGRAGERGARDQRRQIGRAGDRARRQGDLGRPRGSERCCGFDCLCPLAGANRRA
jgi:hypothetical protein